MDISFKTNKLQKACCSAQTCKRQFGNKARRIMQRLAELNAADTLSDMSKLPGARCHPLKGDLNGFYAVDLVHPYRLLFEIANNPEPKKDDGGIDLKKVTKIRVVAVADYHG